MNILRIVSKKIPKSNVADFYPALTELQNELTLEARNSNKGYIHSQSYFTINDSINDKTILYNISDWRSYSSWLEWYNSDIRLAIYEKYDIIDTESHVKLRTRLPFNETPLL